MDDTLYVVAVINNPCQYASRIRLYNEFAERIKAAGAKLITVECAFGERDHDVTEPDNESHVQLRSSTELWIKENLINLGVAHLTRHHPEWKYVAWIDADIEFLNTGWVKRTVHQLQHTPVIQLFEDAIDLGPLMQTVQTHKGFCRQYRIGDRFGFGEGYTFWHPGFAWACTRSAWNYLGGLLDIPPLGAADHHMALALIGKAEYSLPGGVTAGYRDAILNWQENAKHIHRHIAAIPGTILHHWHGKKKDRKYVERWDIVVKGKFDPNRDIKRNAYGVYELAGNNYEFRDGIYKYFRQRSEDSIDME